MTHDVFISHSSHDRDVADAACTALEQRGIKCWIAPRDMNPGQDYGEATADGISVARLLLLIFSAESNESVQARREVERAGGHGLPVLAFRIADVAPAPSRRPLQPTLPPRPFPTERRKRHVWLPIAMAGAIGIVAIALAAAYVSPSLRASAPR